MAISNYDSIGDEYAKVYAREFGGFPRGTSLIAVNGHTRGWDDCVKHIVAPLAEKLQAKEAQCEELVEALENFQLGHIHEANQPHIRVMGDTYGWCGICQEKVSFGPGDAEKALAKYRATKEET